MNESIEEANFFRRDVTSVTVKFADGTELVANNLQGLLRCSTNDNGVTRYKPKGTWRVWELRWSEHNGTMVPER